MTTDHTNLPPVQSLRPVDESVPQRGEAAAGTRHSVQEAQQPSAFVSSVPEDIRVPWDWIDLILFAFLSIGGTFVVSMALVFAFSAFHISAAQLRNSASLRAYFAVLNQVVLSFALLGFMAVQVRTRAQVPFWPTVGWRRLETGRIPRAVAYIGLAMAGLLLSMLVQFVSNASRPKAKLPIEAFFQDRRSALALMAVSVVFAPFFEETIFRGYIYPALARSMGVAASVVVTGTLFGLMHAPQLWGGWVQIVLLVLVGILFTYARSRTRTVVTSYILHLSYNSFLFLAFLIGSSHWLHTMPRH
jgi:membrane protease YdiL (CAAX protease family)